MMKMQGSSKIKTWVLSEGDFRIIQHGEELLWKPLENRMIIGVVRKKRTKVFKYFMLTESINFVMMKGAASVTCFTKQGVFLKGENRKNISAICAKLCGNKYNTEVNLKISYEIWSYILSTFIILLFVLIINK